MKLGVVIVTFNRLELLKECVEACVNQTEKFEKILIINNASTDGTDRYLDTLNGNNIKVVTMKENIGGAGGFYEGLNILKNENLDYILLIDDDAIIDENFNKNISQEMKENNEEIVAYSGVVKTNNEIQYNHRAHLEKNFKTPASTEEEYQRDHFDYEISTFCGLFVSANLVNKIGLPRKDFFIWYDDCEYSLRIIKHGKIRNVNSAILNHKTVIKKEKNNVDWKSYYGYRNRIIIYKDYFSKICLKKYYMYLYLKCFMCKITGKKYESQLIKDAINDGKNQNMGKNVKYLAKKK